MRLRTVLTTIGFFGACFADGAGYYNMPTSLQQCLGVGFGPGHHAPLLLGPCWKSGVTAQGVRRLSAPLAVPSPCGEFGEASYFGADPANSLFGEWGGSYSTQGNGYGAEFSSTPSAAWSAAPMAPPASGPAFTPPKKRSIGEEIPAPTPKKPAPTT